MFHHLDNIPSKIRNRAEKAARRQAEKSIMYFQHGATIISSSGYVIVSACNTPFGHAENLVIQKLLLKPPHIISDAKYMVVVRINRSGKHFLLSKPCQVCESKIFEYKHLIKAVYHS